METTIVSGLAVLGLIATLAGVPIFSRFAPKWGLLDYPTGRRAHSRPIPLVGGIAIFLPLFVAFAVSLGFGLGQHGRILGERSGLHLSLFFGTVCILLLGIVDDRQKLSWGKKLLGQGAAVLILAVGGHTLRGATIPFFGEVQFGWYGVFLFGLAVLVITNAINLIDGLDGLAAGICFFASLTCGAIASIKGDVFSAAIGWTLAGSLLGFLPYNWPPAKAFLGDAGSLMLGFLLGTLALSSFAMHSGQRSATISVLLVPLLPFGIALLDLGIAVIRRWIRGRRIYLPDADHLHHRLMAEFHNPRVVVAIVYAFTALLASLAIAFVLLPGEQTSKAATWIVFGLISIAAVFVLKLYRVNKLTQAIHNRPHFQFLDSYLTFMTQRLKRAGTRDEIVKLLETGTRDLYFDSVEIYDNGNCVGRWTNHEPVHVGAARVTWNKRIESHDLTIRCVVPRHDTEPYQECLELVWNDFLEEFEARWNDRCCCGVRAEANGLGDSPALNITESKTNLSRQNP